MIFLLHLCKYPQWINGSISSICSGIVLTCGFYFRQYQHTAHFNRSYLALVLVAELIMSPISVQVNWCVQQVIWRLWVRVPPGSHSFYQTNSILISSVWRFQSHLDNLFFYKTVKCALYKSTQSTKLMVTFYLFKFVDMFLEVEHALRHVASKLCNFSTQLIFAGHTSNLASWPNG